jgi:hypothetical protein
MRKVKIYDKFCKENVEYHYYKKIVDIPDKNFILYFHTTVGNLLKMFEIVKDYKLKYRGIDIFTDKKSNICNKASDKNIAAVIRKKERNQNMILIFTKGKPKKSGWCYKWEVIYIVRDGKIYKKEYEHSKQLEGKESIWN